MRILAIIIAFFASTTTWATSGLTANTTIEDKTITVYFSENQPQLVSISIEDEAGIQLHAEKIETSNLKSRKYNLKNLPYGNYTLKIESAQIITYKEFELDRSKSSLVSEHTSYKPTNVFNNNKWSMSLLAQGEKVTIEILDEDYEKVYTEKVSKQAVVNKSFDLKELPQGIYTLYVKVGKNSYRKVIAKT